MPNQDTSIFQEIDETDPEQCLQEVDRLIPKLRAFKSHQTSAYNVLANLIKTSRGDNNRFDRSKENMDAIERSRLKLEQRYEKVNRCFHRMLSLINDKKMQDTLEKK